MVDGVVWEICRNHYMIVECPYIADWRKANQIHNWFVQNVQGGKDDCGEHYVSTEQLTELRDLCQKILDTATLVPGKVKIGQRWSKEGGWEQLYEDGQLITNHEDIEALLPTTNGLFFGSTEYDSYYLQAIKDTKEVLDKVLSADTKGWGFEYHSSW